MKSLLALAAMAFVAVAVWWMQSNFGPTFAMAVVGSLLGAVIVIVGVMLGLAANKASLKAAADFHRETMKTEQARMGVLKEQQKAETERAKIERIYSDARTKLDYLDAKRIDKLAQQRAKLLAKDKSEDVPTWGVDYEQEQPTQGGTFGRAVRFVDSMFGDDGEEW